jgi:hypothetical protein
LDLGLLHDSFGDANAMIRKSVFEKIGYQIEDYGYTAHDWELFARVCLAGLKLRLIPEPLYWYRASAQGMYRTSSWFENRVPILRAYKKAGFENLEHIFHMVMSANVTDTERYGFRENLRYSPSDRSYLKLCELAPNSEEALALLAQIAASEGRPNTAVGLLADGLPATFRQRLSGLYGIRSQADLALAELMAPFAQERQLEEQELRQFQLHAISGGDIFYVERADKLYLGARGSDPAVAVWAAGCPKGTVGVSAGIELADERTGACQFLILVTPRHVDPRVAVMLATEQPGDGSSGWCTVSHSWSPRDIAAICSVPTEEPANLVMGVRAQPGASAANAVGCFSGLTLVESLGHPPDPSRRSLSARFRLIRGGFWGARPPLRKALVTTAVGASATCSHDGKRSLRLPNARAVLTSDVC